MLDDAFDTPETKPSGFRQRLRAPLEMLAIVALLSGVYWWIGRPAPTPTFFGQSFSLDDAMARAEKDDKVVFAYATADWCAPCQTFKRGALSNERVIDWMKQNAIPVYIDIDDNPEDAVRLGVNPIPASFVIADGRIVDSVDGPLSTERFLAWLERARQRAQQSN
jgi:thiol:disulfide interchange protein